MHDNAGDRQRFLELLPFYVNRSLLAADLAWMNGYLLNQPDAQNQLRFEELLRDTAKSTVSQVPETQRLAKLMDALGQERQKLNPKGGLRNK